MNNVFRDRFRQLSFGIFSIVAALLIFESICVGQGGTTGSIAGTVTDPNKAFVAGATVLVTDNATKQEFTAVTNDEGYFRIPTLSTGVYTATITGQGFKKAVVTDIKVNVATPSTIAVQMELGAPSEQITVVGGGELLRTENANVGTTLTGRQITDIPTASRDALDLVLAMPGTGTPGRPRTSSINGLPKGALTITIDGVNVQDNLLKSSDGFFTYIRPRTDAISEVTVSTSNPGAESSGEGAAQIKFATQSGSNAYHGGIYWYHRNPALNTNYWFSNRDLPADPVTHKAPQQRILLNQPGGKIGGPIWIPKLLGKDKAFFFVNYEEYRLPEKSSLRTRTILNPAAQTGIFQYTTTNAAYAAAPPPNVTCTGTGTFTCSVNVFTLALNAGLPNTPDPTIAALLSSERSALSGAIIKNVGGNTPMLQQASFFNPGGQTRKFPTVRFDFNVTKKHHIEDIWNYQIFDSKVDFLNGVDPAFPGFPNFGSQDSLRWSNSLGWRWNISNNLVNEARYGLTGGSTLFFPEINAGQFQNQGGVALNVSGPGISNATVSSAPSRRNTPLNTITDTLNWVKGNHTINFGGDYTRVNSWQYGQTVVPTVGFGISSTLVGDTTAFGAFSSLQPTVSQQAAAASLYATLVGRINSITATARLNEDTDQYSYLGPLVQRAKQDQYGFYAQDTWRMKQNLTVNGGLRWEIQGPFQVKNGVYSSLTDFAGLYGESGINNLFKPGTLTGAPTAYERLEPGGKAYNLQWGNIAPSVGFAWQPSFKNKFLHRLSGDAGQTVVRGGFSMAYVREGIAAFGSIFSANPGGSISTTQSTSGTPFPLSFGNLFRNGLPARPAFPSSPIYPNTGLITDTANAFDPDIKTGYVESWTIGIQREINSNNVIEVRYVGNRGHQLWRQMDLNETNLTENGFIQEYRNAQANLIANINAGRGLNFRYFGPNTGTVPLPILLGYFAGLPINNPANASNPANYSSTLFANSTFTTALNPLSASPGGGRCCAGFAGTIASAANEPTFNANRIAAGIPYNFFVVNPGKRGGAFLMTNGTQTWYDALQFEFRRRLSQGLLIQANYTFAKALVNSYASNSDIFDQPGTLRNINDRKGVTPFDITQAFKTNFIWELPVGKGKAFLGGANGWVNSLIGDWAVNGNIRIQSGSPFSFGNVQLVGITAKELQNLVGIYKNQPDADGINRGNVWIFPLDFRQNTFRAFNTGFATGTNLPLYTQGAPTGAYMAPSGLNCTQQVVGGCGLTNLVLKGPMFTRFDLSVSKRIRFTERINGEIRAEFLNAFNNINFLVGSASNDINTLGGQGTTTFGRYTAAYQDISTTNDPGGRLIQLVLRLNF